MEKYWKWKTKGEKEKEKKVVAFSFPPHSKAGESHFFFWRHVDNWYAFGSSGVTTSVRGHQRVNQSVVHTGIMVLVWTKIGWPVSTVFSLPFIYSVSRRENGFIFLSCEEKEGNCHKTRKWNVCTMNPHPRYLFFAHDTHVKKTRDKPFIFLGSTCVVRHHKECEHFVTNDYMNT